MEPIAIVGMGCRFPGAESVSAFEHLLENGLEGVREVTPDRWDNEAYHDEDPKAPGKINARRCALLSSIDQFDAAFFGISRREAELMDPQQRVSLEVAWEALEAACVPPLSLAGSRTGVFLGLANSDYNRMIYRDPRRIEAHHGTGVALSINANRLSYLLNLKGPSLVVDTACSSSLVAVHLACQSLRTGESDLALAGGVSLILSPESSITFTKSGMMAPDGRCKTFDAAADGYGRGEGCGIVVLKRLADAVRDGNAIWAVIRGSAVNQDGLTNGLTAPSGPSQEAVLQEALRNAGVPARAIGYVEAHGTGTPLGDPIEWRALGRVLSEGRSREEPCWVGSVKTNIGHLEAAAGIAGLIKTVLSLRQKRIYPHLHFKRPNPYLASEHECLRVPVEPHAWGSTPRLAGVSAFGFGGTNAHLVLEEAGAVPSPVQPLQKAERPLHVLALSAKSDEALGQLARAYHEHLVAHPRLDAASVCFSANVGRSHLGRRLCIVGSSDAQLRQALASVVADAGLVRPASTVRHGQRPPRLVFLFKEGSPELLEAGRELFATQPAFRRAVEHCAASMEASLWPGLLDAFSGRGPTCEGPGQEALACFAVQYGLAQLCVSWGLEVQAVTAEGLGHYAAACFAGVLPLADALRLAARAAELRASPDEASRLEAHERILRGLRLSPPGCEFVTRAGLEMPVTRVEFWRSCPRMRGGASSALESPGAGGGSVLIEVGMPSSDAQGAETSARAEPEEGAFVASALRWERLEARLSLIGRGPGVWPALLRCVAELYVRGVSLDWAAFEREYPRPWVALPSYPFQRQRYWFQTETRTAPAEKQEAVPTAPVAQLKDCFYEMVWHASAPSSTGGLEAAREGGLWVVFGHPDGFFQTFTRELERHAIPHVAVEWGEALRKLDERRWLLNPANEREYAELFRSLRGRVGRIVWLSEPPAREARRLTAERLERARTEGFRAIQLVRAVLGQPGVERPAFAFVTRRAAPVLPGESPCLEQAPLVGVAKSLGQEHPELRGKWIDVGEQEGPEAARDVLLELSGPDRERSVAFRQGGRHVPGVERRAVPAHREPIIRGDGTYLITGGLGALGMHTARWLVQQGARSLVLVSRGGARREHESAVRELQAAGAKVSMAPVDVADAAAVERLVAELRQGAPPLRGIIHAAGVSRPCRFADIDWDTWDAICRPKILGSWNLHEASRQAELDFFVSYSSVAALWGVANQAPYSAANAFVDALAHHRQGLELPGLSINWGPWQAGMASSGYRQWLERKGIRALRPSLALEALSRLLPGPRAQTAVVDLDWQAFDAVRTGNGEQVSRLEDAPSLESVVAKLCVLVANIARISPDEVDPAQPLSASGLDSIMLLEIQSDISLRFGAELTLEQVASCQDIQELAALVLQGRSSSPSPVTNVVALQVPAEPTRHGEEGSGSAHAPESGPDSRELEPERYRFEMCPEVRELEQRIHAARTQGAANPYFRLGDGVSEQTLVVEGREVINYSGYNYLGLAAHPHVKAAVMQAIERYGTSVSASRIASGDRPLHRELERALADWLGMPSCIAFVGGHATNETTIGHLFNGEDLILTDALSHNSLLQGCRLSGATHLVFPHNDWRRLDELLGQRRHRYRRALIVIEGLYSMDGDIPELPRFIDIKRKHKSFLMVDEAHSIGVLGRTGRGIAEHFQVDPRGVDLWMGTLSKALASCGGYIACQEAVAEYLKYTAPGFVYSVGMTPSNAAAALAALQVLQQDPSPLAVLKERASLFLELARSAGLDTGMSQGTPVIPIMLGDSLLALRLSNGLLQRGIGVQPVISPAVQERAARLRFFLNCLHTEEQIRYTVAAVAEELERARHLPAKERALVGH